MGMEAVGNRKGWVPKDASPCQVLDQLPECFGEMGFGKSVCNSVPQIDIQKTPPLAPAFAASRTASADCASQSNNRASILELAVRFSVCTQARACSRVPSILSARPRTDNAGGRQAVYFCPFRRWHLDQTPMCEGRTIKPKPVMLLYNSHIEVCAKVSIRA